MTSKIVAFTFNIANPAEPKVTKVTLGERLVEAGSGQKASAVMAGVMNRLLPTLRRNHANYYDLLISRPEFIVSFEMPADQTKFSVTISNDAGVDIVQPLSQQTCDKLNIRSLKERTTASNHLTSLGKTETAVSRTFKQSTKRAKTPLPKGAPTPSPVHSQRSFNKKIKPPEETQEEPRWVKMSKEEFKELHERLSNLQPIDTLKIPLQKSQVKATPVPPKTPCFLYRIVAAIFTAIGDYWKSFSTLFSSDNDELHYEPLIPNTKTQETYTADQTDFTSIPKSIHGIRPLRNGNNICFINGSFQPLMNVTGLIPVLIESHEAKIKKEAKQIEDLEILIEADQSEVADLQSKVDTSYWYNYLMPDDEYKKSVADMNTVSKRCTKRQKDLLNLKNSIQASKTLIKACKGYNDDSQEPVWLNALRGFDPSFRSWSQEDAHDLLVRIWDPVLEPLRNGLNSDGKKDIGVIPANLEPATRKTLGRFVTKIGEEKQLERVVRNGEDEESREIELAAIDNKDMTQLPPNGLRKELRAESSIPFAVPTLAPEENISLQDLVTAQLTMQPLQEQDGTSVYEDNGVRSDYQVTQKRIVIESIGDTPPEFLTLHLKRFAADRSKIQSQITLPKDNKLTVIVDGKDVNYEIHAVEVHQGSSLAGGHYFAYIKKESGWVKADDSHVASHDKLPASVEKDAYIIFLKKVS
ncbi:MAG TPA: ubiquitin carboxyl-terminal hydrolase family protein [Rhabdochlamydiaceae bacterium]|jgi:hypothetical protein|nr:ubiquitin carboxyl-terminal hydrolase family protein [Rhabdochlamydiaceae bacterium]